VNDTPARRPVLTAWHFAGFFVAYLVLAIYGSLVPFHYQPLEWDEAVRRFAAIPYLHITIESRSDWVANILLFIPLSYLFMGMLSVERGLVVRLLAAVVVVAVCTALSVAIEFTQLWFPPRTVSQNDIVAETIGGLVGTTTWLFAGQRITQWMRRLWTTAGAYGIAARLLPGYLALLALVHVMPLDLTISPKEIYDKYYKKGMIHLIPFWTDYEDDIDRYPRFAYLRSTWPGPTGRAVIKGIQKNLANIAWFLPVGLLLAFLRGPFWRDRANWPRILALGFLVAGTIEFMQLFVWTRHFDVTDIVTGTCAVLAGWLLGLAWQPDRERAAPQAGLRWWLLAAWLAVLVLQNWQPFNFNWDEDYAMNRLRAVQLVPFADLYVDTEYHAFDQYMTKTLLFMPVGALLAPRRRGAWWIGLVLFLAGLALATLFELGQAFLPTHYPSVSDVLIEGQGVWLGYVAMRWLYTALQAESRGAGQPVVSG
jgi:glycopeptide antibiotics resistance protein